MTYSIRQLAGLDPVDIDGDGDPIYLDNEREPLSPPGAALRYGTRWPRARAAAEINAALDRLIADLDALSAAGADPF
jgi:hypothetical protein